MSAEVYYRRIHTPQLTDEVSGRDNADDDKENEQVGVREDGDKLGDGVVGNHRGQQLTLVNPPEATRSRGHLYPDGVGGVLRQHAEVGHHQAVALVYRKGIGRQAAQHLLGLLDHERQRVGLY